MFDLDGTLLDTVPIITHCIQKMFLEYGNKALSERDVHQLFGPGESIIFGHAFGQDQVGSIMASYLKCYGQHHNQIVLNDKITALLKMVRTLGLKTAIVTNKERDTTAITLDYFGLRGYFDVIVTAQDVGEPKPSSEGILWALRELKTPIDECLFVGDTLNDVQTAERSGVPFVQALWFVPKRLWIEGPQWETMDSIDAFAERIRRNTETGNAAAEKGLDG